MKRSWKNIWAALVLAIIGSAAVANASVTVSPSSAQVNPGATLQFSASGSSAGIVIWGLSGAGCSGITCGSISSDGLYKAPATAPSPATVTVSAMSLFDVTQVGTATVSIGGGGIAVGISPGSATVPVKGQQQFSATVTGTTNTGVTWSLSGIGCVGGSCGSITSSGLYTAPATVPTPAVATVTATSKADTSKSASASVVIAAASAITVSVSPGSAQVPTAGHQQFTANVTGTTNTAVTWSLAGCSGSCGSISASGLYTAPSSVPSPPTVSVIAKSQADTSASGSATVTVVSGSSLTITPSLPQVKPSGQLQFSASGPGSGIVVWSVNGTGCSGLGCGSITSGGVYSAPASVPNPDTVTVTATSITNPGVSGSTNVTISSSSVHVAVSPDTATVGVGAQKQFAATVTGSTNTAVTWSLTGYACAGTTCGTITPSGLYTAPETAPNPSFFTLTATSVADPSKSASAEITIKQQIGITIAPSSAQVPTGGTRQFTASVTGTSDTGVIWSVSGSGCSGSGCGTISTTGLYRAPDSVPGNVVITATSAADSTVTASANVTVITPVVLTVSPANVIVAVGGKQPFQVSVEGTQNKAVTWSVSGSGCSGTSCGTISTAGVYTAPASLPSPATVTVKATSQVMTSATATATVSLVASNNSKLFGQYAFSFTGYDSTGSYLAVGSFTADGKGKITDGQEDVNNMSGPSTSIPLTGTYQVTSDNRGTLTLQSSLGTFTYKLALNGLGKSGRFVSFDDSGVRGSGVLERQDPAAFDPSAFAHGYVLALSGADYMGAREAALGLIYPDGSGFVSGSSMDINDAGSVAPTYASFFGMYSVDSTGRGTMTLMVPGAGSGFLNFAFYVVSANRFFMISVDPVMMSNLLVSGPGTIQIGDGAPFFSSSFDGPVIFTLSGNSGTAPQDIVGRLTFDGVVNVGGTFDSNYGGKVTTTGKLTGAYDMELNGRGTLNLNSPLGTGQVWYIYATGPNQGFVMDASSMGAGIGQMYMQENVPSFSNSDVLGSYVMGPDDPIVQTTPLASGVVSFDGGSSAGGQGTESGAEDISKASGLSADQAVAGTYTVSGVSNNGRGAVLLTSPEGENIAVWIINGSQFVGLDLGSATTQPVVLHFEQ